MLLVLVKKKVFQMSKSDTSIIAIIPARSGSKGVVNKNIRMCNGKPLIAYSIEHALKSKLINRVIVSTDSEQYAEIGRAYGAEVPFLRPAEISADRSLDIEVFSHALHHLADRENYHPEICVHLRPTHPVREPEAIDEMIEMLLRNPDIDSVRSVTPSKCTPYKMWLKDDKGMLSPVATCDIKEAYNAPRQALPTAYMHDGCIDVVRSRVIMDNYSMTGNSIAGYVQNMDFDIDTEADFIRAEHYLEIKEKLVRGEKLTICFDIDGVLAEKAAQNDYSKAKPILKNIECLNKLYDMGHTIVLFTARGTVTQIDWKDVTVSQLKKWGVRYSELKFGKPAGDIYVDDRFVEIDSLFDFF
jgi:CMP-N-acetylneuraminic acid synthetase